MLVWIGDKRAYKAHFHSTWDCYRLKGVEKRGGQIIAIPPETLPPGLRPCQECYGPEAGTKTFKGFCWTCESFRACAHNGGVAVRNDHGVLWVWPERAHLYEPLADP